MSDKIITDNSEEILVLRCEEERAGLVHKTKSNPWRTQLILMNPSEAYRIGKELIEKYHDAM